MKLTLAAILLCTAAANAQAPLAYQKPPAPIEQLLDAPALPVVTGIPVPHHYADRAAGALCFHCRGSDPYYSNPVALMSDTHLLLRRESQNESPNYFIATLTGSADAPAFSRITDFPSPSAGINMPTLSL